MTRRISVEGRKIIEHFEGCHEEGSDGLYHSYLCPANVWTIGFGHTKGVVPGMRISKATAHQLLEWDLLAFERGVDAILPVGVSQNCFDAFVSLAFNVGVNAVAESTTLRELKLFLNTGNAKHLEESYRAFLWWNKGGGKVLPGLVARREAELRHWRNN